MITKRIRTESGLPPGKAITATAKQIQFALVLALTRTAKRGQEAVQEGLSDRFHLRREAFARQGIVISPATKAVPVSSIIVRDDWLAQHEEGGTKESVDGGGSGYRGRGASGKSGIYPDWIQKLGLTRGGHVAVPDEYVTADGKRVIPTTMRPKEVLKKATIFPSAIETQAGQKILVILQRKRSKRKKETKRNRRERLGMIKSTQRSSVKRKAKLRAMGAPIASARRSRYRLRRDRPRGYRSPPRREDRGIRVLYLLADQTELAPTRFFRPVIEAAVTKKFADELERALDEAVRPKIRRSK